MSKTDFTQRVDYRAFKLIHDLERLVKFNDKYEFPELKRFVQELNDAMFWFIHQNYLNPLFTATTKFTRYILALYVMHTKSDYFECLLNICDDALEYKYKWQLILNPGTSVESVARRQDMFDSGKLELGRLKNSALSILRFLGETKQSVHSWFYIADKKVIEEMMKARRDKLGNPKDGSSWNQLLLFYFKSRTVLNRDMIMAIYRAFRKGKLSFLKKLTVPMIVDVAAEDIQANPMLYLRFFRHEAAEDESHIHEPGDWYLNPHPCIWIRNKMLSELSDIEEKEEE